MKQNSNRQDKGRYKLQKQAIAKLGAKSVKTGIRKTPLIFID